MNKERSVAVATQDDLIMARQVVRALAREEGFQTVEQTRLATAVGELARNALLYAGKGICTMQVRRNERDVSIVVTMIDEGPGIADIETALTPGFSMSWGGGLVGARRLVDRLDISSEPGHTEVSITLNRRL
ncbi:MAG: putative anti-sigma regulatory factor [Rhodospirillaceae bacterium]|nr:MAG: putative anti-sigma regulatory factor [Rhodospirillaceae bacterium]